MKQLQQKQSELEQRLAHASSALHEAQEQAHCASRSEGNTAAFNATAAAARRSAVRARQAVATLAAVHVEARATATKLADALKSTRQAHSRIETALAGANAQAREGESRTKRAVVQLEAAKVEQQARGDALTTAQATVAQARAAADLARRRHDDARAAAQPLRFRGAVEQLKARLGSKRVRGMICDLGVTVKSERALTAVNEVLRRQLVQTVVVDSRATGTAVAAYFKSNHLGRVRCLLCDELPRVPLRTKSPPAPLAVPLLDTLQVPTDASRVMHALLGSWWLVPDANCLVDERFRGLNIVDVHGAVQRTTGEVSGGACDRGSNVPDWARLSTQVFKRGSSRPVNAASGTAAELSVEKATAALEAAQARERQLRQLLARARAATEACRAEHTSATRALASATARCSTLQV